MKIINIGLVTLLSTGISYAALERNKPELAPNDEKWHQWEIHPYTDNSASHHALQSSSFICIRNIGDEGTHTLYEWYAFQNAKQEDTLGRGVQEGDHFYFHAEFPRVDWPSGGHNPPSILVLNGQTIGGDTKHLDQKYKAFAEVLAWNPGKNYKETSVYNIEMTNHGRFCEPENKEESQPLGEASENPLSPTTPQTEQ